MTDLASIETSGPSMNMSIRVLYSARAAFVFQDVGLTALSSRLFSLDAAFRETAMYRTSMTRFTRKLKSERADAFALSITMLFVLYISTSRVVYCGPPPSTSIMEKLVKQNRKISSAADSTVGMIRGRVIVRNVCTLDEPRR